MKYLLLITAIVSTLNAQADCYENLTDGYSQDSRHFSLNIDEIYSEKVEKVSVRAVEYIYEQQNCGKPHFVEVSCRQLGKHSWSKSCYIETKEGYFFVAEDMVQSVNVTFNRFD
jgi:hypothetical protein